MLKHFKKPISTKDVPEKFCEETVKRIARIESVHSVLGVMFIQNDIVDMYTVPESMAQGLTKKLPLLHSAMHRALTEIDIQNELVAYRIESKTLEIVVAAGKEFAAVVVQKDYKLQTKHKRTMKIISNLLKDSQDEWLVSMTSLINKVNPMVDRIMDDESVEGVVMTNKEGVPVLTNVSIISATNYALNLHRYGSMAQNYVKELDPFDEVLVVRLKTKKVEMMLAPDPEFNIIVVQHFRHIIKEIHMIKK